MADWRQWIMIAEESRRAALEMTDEPAFRRSRASRYYYAAYQAVTALLLYEGQTPPIVDGIERESWSHEVTPTMALDNLGRVLPVRKKRYQIRSGLQELYKIRIFADYSGANEITAERLKAARKLSSHIVKVARDILPDVE
jgi:uncharacterized protein (UPF0332 family)